ncbi:nuclear transport factor 2 family protein [Baekduia soli]|uniref:Nuclear transport factor 2 family protein n=1 Tax=Baekduia soli TaxID=496014 RepID=A0A5B8U1R0_9ACTN|nr:nuclear transport factor 2 family protein [Baekduia soli]QEC46979.1 nuclear transport factor 2 family protein [Baekduia soli]
MNAVERLWRALRKEDWEAAEAQLHEHAVVRWPHTGERFDRAIDYVTAHRLDVDRRAIDVRRVVRDGRDIGVWVVLTYADGGPRWHGAAVYELQETRIAHATEVWTEEGGRAVPGFRRRHELGDGGA